VGKLISRLLYFFVRGKKIIMVHGIRNKGKSIAARDLKVALERKRDWHERFAQ
jgi:phage-related protein